jgi:hypothetical protein
MYELIWVYRFVAAEDGVYEFKVNLQGRKIFPDINLR